MKKHCVTLVTGKTNLASGSFHRANRVLNASEFQEILFEYFDTETLGLRARRTLNKGYINLHQTT